MSGLHISRLTSCAVALFALAACGAQSATPQTSPTQTDSAPMPVSTTVSVESTTTAAPADLVGPITETAGLVIERRSMTNAERERLDSEDAPPLDCDDVGEAFWDYDNSAEPGTPGRTADDALVEVINEFNDQARTDPRSSLDYDYVPLNGWIELIDGGSSTFVHTTGAWRFAIEIGGSASLANWRPLGALICQPDLGSDQSGT